MSISKKTLEHPVLTLIVFALLGTIGIFTLKNVACLGCCSLSPVMMINDETYGSLTPEKAISIFKELKEKAGDEEK